MAKHVSRAEIRRQREGLLASRSERVPLPAELQRRVESFQPTSLDDVAWVEVRPLFLAVMACSSTRGAEAFAKRCSALAAFLAWGAGEGLELAIPSMMRVEVIDEYVRTLSTSTAASRRSHLRSLAGDSNPAGVPARPLRYEHNPVRPPYTDAEMAAIRRIALNQPTDSQRRSTCAVIGLGRGAGIDSQDFRHLRVAAVEDQGEQGIWVVVGAPRARLVPLRREWEDLVRAGIESRASNELVIGTSTTRRNIAAKVIEKATILGSGPKIEPGRLRTTWLADLLTAEVPLSVVMAVSGLRSARTIVEVLGHLDEGADLGSAR